jgi:hypothetical protein
MKSWGSFFWGVLFGSCIGHSAGCADQSLGHLFPGRLCHFPASEAIIEVHDPRGLYAPMSGARTFESDTTTSCYQHAGFMGGSHLSMTCRADEPVEFCSVSGECVDSDSGNTFRCEGSVTFQ